jgi:hypothetical protein
MWTAGKEQQQQQQRSVWSPKKKWDEIAKLTLMDIHAATQITVDKLTAF